MKIAKWKMLSVVILAVALLALSAGPVMALDVPVTSFFSGDVAIDGDPAPDGSGVAAFVGGETEPRETTTTTDGTYGIMLVGSTGDVGQAVSFEVQEVGAVEWLEATTLPESPTYASYDPQVVNLFAFTTPAPPVAGFSANPTSGERPLEVFFTDESTSYAGITLWEWDFSYDGEHFNVESTEQDPVYTYGTVGMHTVALKVTADEGSNMMVAENLITVTAPEDPVIDYAGVYYIIGVEVARPGDQFEVAAMVTDDTAVTLVEVETPFGTFPLVGEEYEGIAIYWVFEEVPQDIQPGTYELTLIAEDEDGNTATQSLELEVALSLTAYNVWLADGWNLISLPLIPDVADTETVLDGLSFPGEDMVRVVFGDEIADGMIPVLDSVWYYDAVGEYGTAGEWLFFEPDAEVGDLTEMEDGKGYWVDVVMDEEASHGALTAYGVELVSGPTLPPTYAVVEGWNLIGFKEISGMHFSQYLSAVEGKYARIYAYDTYSQRFYLVGEGGQEHMQPCAGYWIYMTDDGYIVP